MRNWQRYEEAKRLRDTGLTLKATGALLGVSGPRVRDMLATLERRERGRAFEAENPRTPPWHEGLKHRTVYELERAGFDSRDACMTLAAKELTMWRGAVALPGWEEYKQSWRWKWCEKRLTLAMVNEVRTWLGAAPYVPVARVASAAELERARRLLERNGWRVEPPNV